MLHVLATIFPEYLWGITSIIVENLIAKLSIILTKNTIFCVCTHVLTSVRVTTPTNLPRLVTYA